jgi:excinuclease ABC subunit A
MFSFNSPQGACPGCGGLGTKRYFDPGLIVPNPSLSVNEGAVLPWKEKEEAFLRPILEGLAKQYPLNLDTPFNRLPKSVQRLLLYGSEGEKVSFRVKGKGKSHLFRKWRGDGRSRKKTMRNWRDL